MLILQQLRQVSLLCGCHVEVQTYGRKLLIRGLTEIGREPCPDRNDLPYRSTIRIRDLPADAILWRSVRRGNQRPEYCENGNQKTGKGKTAGDRHFCSTTLH